MAQVRDWSTERRNVKESRKDVDVECGDFWYDGNWQLGIYRKDGKVLRLYLSLEEFLSLRRQMDDVAERLTGLVGES